MMNSSLFKSMGSVLRKLLSFSNYKSGKRTRREICRRIFQLRMPRLCAVKFPDEPVRNSWIFVQRQRAKNVEFRIVLNVTLHNFVSLGIAYRGN